MLCRTSANSIMTSSNGNIFRVTGPLCGEFTGPGEFPTQRPVTRSFDVFFDLCLNKRLSEQSWGWWFETQSWSLWRHSNAVKNLCYLTCHITVTWQVLLMCGGQLASLIPLMVDHMLLSHIFAVRLQAEPVDVTFLWFVGQATQQMGRCRC